MENTCVCCGRVIPEGSQVCSICLSRATYTKRNCPECGESLEVYYDGPNSSHHEPFLIRHCEKCLCDWESDYYDDGNESELRRKFWG